MTPPTSTPVTPNSRVALVTGANSGIGRVTAVELALRGYHVFLACRDAGKTAEVLDEIAQRSGGTAKAEFIALDLGDLDSVRQCAQAFNARELPLHLLVNNAGLAGQKGFTKSGFELAFGVCHVGHFLLTRLLLDRLKQAAPSRVVVVASRAHRHAKGIDFAAVRQPSRSRGGLMDYSVAKLANILFAAELGRRLAGTGVTTYALHPGVVGTNVWRSVPWPLDRPGQAVHDRLGRGREDHAVLRHVRCGGAADRPVLRQVRRGHAHARGPGCRTGAGAVDGQRGWTQD
jgi:retinol dehydrogenase-12